MRSSSAPKLLLLWKRHSMAGGGISSTPSGPAFLLRDDFKDTLAAGSVNGTAATPGPGTRVVVDTGTKISVGSGVLNFATGATANDGLWLDVQTRAAGRFLIATITPADTAGIPKVGWDTNQTGAINDALLFSTTTGIQIVANGGTAFTVGAYTATAYQVAAVMSGTGIYWFIKGGAFTSWKLLYKTAAGTANSYPSIGAGNTTSVFTASFLRVPVALYIPPIDTYDTFTRSNGAIGTSETTGPDSQSVTAKTWTGATWTVASNAAVNTPTEGAEVVVNGTMELDSNWNNFDAPATNERSAVQAHAGTYSRHFIQNSTYEGIQSDTFALTAGIWYRAGGWFYRTDAGTSATILSFRQAAGTVLGSTSFTGNKNAWKNLQVVGRALATVATGFIAGYTADATGEAYCDDFTVMPLTLSTLFASIQVATANVVASCAITFDAASSIQAGLVICLDSAASPANFIIVYANRSDNKIYVDKCVAGTYTNVASTAYTYSAGTNLVVVKDSTSVTVWYANALVGSVSTVSDAGIVSNTLHGLFSTGTPTQAQLDTFLVQARGNEGQYSVLDRYVKNG